MKERIINLLIYIILAWLFMLWWIMLYKSSEAEASSIWQLAEEINALQDKKQECYDNLTYAESVRSRAWKERFCYEWDETIMSLRAELDELTYHPYMSMGL